jgi:hypothetical protein
MLIWPHHLEKPVVNAVLRCTYVVETANTSSRSTTQSPAIMAAKLRYGRKNATGAKNSVILLRAVFTKNNVKFV